MVENRDTAYLKGLSIDSSGHVEKKGKFSYLSWPYAFAELKQLYPEAHYMVRTFIDWDKVYEIHGSVGDAVVNALAMRDMLPRVPYLKHNRGSWVCVDLFLDEHGAGHQELWFPILDNANKPIADPSSFDANTANQRGKVKVIAEGTGIGLYIYAGEDLPDALVAGGSKFISDEGAAEFEELLKHVAMNIPIEGRNDGKTRADMLREKYKALGGWVFEEIKVDTPKIVKFIAEWEQKNQMTQVEAPETATANA